jgi:hypothetical protein
VNVLRAIAWAFAELRLLATLLVVNLFVASIGALPVLFPSLQAFGHSGLERGRPFPSPAVWNDFSHLLQRSGAFLAGSVVLAGIAGYLVQFLVSSGIASRAWSAGPFRLADFLADVGRFLWRNVRLFLWSLLGLLVVVGLAVGSAVALDAAEQKTLFTAEGVEWLLDPPFTASSLAHLAFVLVLLTTWRASLDLARVKMVATGERKTRKLAWRALKQMLGSPGTLGSYAAVSALGLAAFLALTRVHGSIAETSTAKALLTIGVGQLVIWTRLAFVVAGYELVADLERRTPLSPPRLPLPEPVPVNPEPPEIPPDPGPAPVV